MNAFRWILYFFAVLFFGCGAPFSSTADVVDGGLEAADKNDSNAPSSADVDAGDALEHVDAAAVDVAGDELAADVVAVDAGPAMCCWIAWQAAGGCCPAPGDPSCASPWDGGRCETTSGCPISLQACP